MYVNTQKRRMQGSMIQRRFVRKNIILIALDLEKMRKFYFGLYSYALAFWFQKANCMGFSLQTLEIVCPEDEKCYQLN